MGTAHYGSTLPEAFLDLDEVNAPTPVSEREEDDEPSLEQRISRGPSNAERASSNRVDSTILSSESALNQLHGRIHDHHGHEIHAQDLNGFSYKDTDSIPSTKPDHELYDRAQSYAARGQHQGYHGHLTEIAAPPPVDVSHGDRELVEKTSDESSAPSQSATKMYTISYLIFFSIWGTLARLGLQALTIYPGAPVTQGVLWANIAGSLIMGFLAEDRKLFQEPWETTSTQLTRLPTPERNKKYTAMKKTIPLYIGLSTGFCGCFTSFSSWQRDAFLAMSNAAPVVGSSSGGETPIPRNGGFSLMALLATLILTPTLCLGALQFGAHLALAFDPITPKLSFRVTRNIIDPSIAAIAWLSWLGAVFLAIWPPDRPGGPSGHSLWSQETWRGDAIFACVFAPLGCLTRLYVSIWLNGRIPAFPLGTFTVNVSGSILEAMFYDLQHSTFASTIGGGRVACQALQGLMDGYCGSTTTISTWVAEIKGLRRRHAYIYALISTFVALAFMIIIMGSILWTKGFAVTSCGK